MCFVSRPSAVCYSSLLCFYAPIGSSRSSLFSCLFFCDVSGSTLLHPSVSVKQQNFKIWTFSWQSCPPDVARALEVVVAWVARRCTSLALWKFDCILTGVFVVVVWSEQVVISLGLWDSSWTGPLPSSTFVDPRRRLWTTRRPSPPLLASPQFQG